MTDDSTMPPAGRATSGWGPAGSEARRAYGAAALVALGSVVAGVVAGVLWAAIAPRVQYQVYTLKPPTAYATNPETSAFIAADGTYSFIALGAGVLAGLLSYLFAIRRWRAVPMIGLVAGSVAAAFIMAWVGHLASGGLGFDHVLATSKPGSFLSAPISLGARGALAFWPLGAAAVVGGIELARSLRARRQAPEYVPMPGMDTFGWQAGTGRPGPAGPDSGGPDAGDPPDGRVRPDDSSQPGSRWRADAQWQPDGQWQTDGQWQPDGERQADVRRQADPGRGWWQQAPGDQNHEAAQPGWSADPPGWSAQPPGTEPGRR